MDCSNKQRRDIDTQIDAQQYNRIFKHNRKREKNEMNLA